MHIDIRTIKEYVWSPLYRNALFLMASIVARAGLGFVFWVVVARLYTNAEVGWGSAIISAISLLAILSVPGFSQAIIRFLPKADKPQDMINSCVTVSGIAALSLAVIFVAGLDIWSPAIGFVGKNIIFSISFILFVLLMAISALIDSVFIAGRRAEFVFYKLIIALLSRLALSVFLALFFHSFGIAASWGFAVTLALAVSILLFLPRVQKWNKPMHWLNLGIIREMWRYSAASYFASIFGIFPVLILPIIVVNLLGAEQNAYFYACWMIANVLFSVPRSTSRSLFAEGSYFEDELWGNVGRSLKFIYIFLIPAVVLVLLIGKWLLLVFGESYSINGLLLLRVLCLSSLFLGINRVYTSTLRVENRMGELLFIYGFQGAAVLLGTFLITRVAGIAGVGYVWFAVQMIVSIYAILSIRSRYGLRWIWHTKRQKENEGQKRTSM
jgi:O-antigen/teichoic acid export membrane protein